MGEILQNNNTLTNRDNEKAYYYGFSFAELDPSDNSGGDIGTPPDGMSLNQNLSKNLQKYLGGNRAVIIFEWGDKTVARVEWLKYYVELTMNTKDLQPKPLESIVEFYHLALKKLEQRQAIHATAQGLLDSTKEKLNA